VVVLTVGLRHSTSTPPLSNVSTFAPPSATPTSLRTATPSASASAAPSSALRNAPLTTNELGSPGVTLRYVSCSFGSAISSGTGSQGSSCTDFNDSAGNTWLSIEMGLFDTGADAHAQYLTWLNLNTATTTYAAGNEGFSQSSCGTTTCTRFAVSWRQ